MSQRSAIGLLTLAMAASLSCAVTSQPLGSATPDPSHGLNAGTTTAVSPRTAAKPGEPDHATQREADADAAARLDEIAAVRSELDRRRTGLAPDEREALARAIVIEAHRHHLDPALVMAVMHVESRFDNFALSPVGAMGLMQILPSTGKELAAKHGVSWYGPQTLFDPVVNVRLGVAYLKQLTDRFGNVSTALAAYNWGPGHIDRRIRRGHQLPRTYPRLVLEAHAAAQSRS
ncbi:MAG: lytic transglycosylase domain-containing protein [Myxococcota bacterium]|nr:lytic transglycosylase domain-containing protein [Myxococcota bacterium]